MRRLLLPAVLALALGGCQAGGDMDAAEQQVAGFHRRYGAGQFEPVFAESSPVLKELTPRPQFLAFLAETRKRLGPVKSTKQTGWNANYATGGSQVTLTYETVFANGAGTETFVYDTRDPPRLMGYHIDAPAVAAP